MQTMTAAKRQINYKTMRRIVGAIALLLAPVVWILSGEPELTSISISYWTDSRDVFVGALIAIGFFLSAYNGAGEGKDWEFWLGKAAGVFATCVALFPTRGFSSTDLPAEWVRAITGAIGVEPKSLHYGAAVLLFACLIGLMYFFYRHAMDKEQPGRAYFYLGVSILMVVGMAGVFFIGKLLHLSDTIFWVEVCGLTLFGAGWLRAGTYQTS